MADKPNMKESSFLHSIVSKKYITQNIVIVSIDTNNNFRKHCTLKVVITKIDCLSGVSRHLDSLSAI